MSERASYYFIKKNYAFFTGFFQLERIPCNILVAPGHSAYCSIPNYDDSSLQVSYVYQYSVTCLNQFE